MKVRQQALKRLCHIARKAEGGYGDDTSTEGSHPFSGAKSGEKPSSKLRLQVLFAERLLAVMDPAERFLNPLSNLSIVMSCRRHVFCHIQSLGHAPDAMNCLMRDGDVAQSALNQLR